MDAKFHIFCLTPEYPFAKSVAATAMRQVAKQPPQLLGVSRTALSIAAAVAHEMYHYLYFSSHPACLAANYSEHSVYGQKINILSKHGSEHYLPELKPEYSLSEVTNPEIFAEYMDLAHREAIRDLFLNFGRYPIERIKQHNEMRKSHPGTITLIKGDFLPRILMPTDEELDITREGPTLEEISESLAALGEMQFLASQIRHHGPEAAQLLQEFREQYGIRQRYARALAFACQATSLSEAFALPVAILNFALCGPCIYDGQVSWAEFHPTTRLRKLLDAAHVVPSSLRKLDMRSVDLISGFFEIDAILSRKLGWRTVQQNLQAALHYVDTLIATYKNLNFLPAYRARSYLREKINNLAFPHRLSKLEIVLQTPVAIFSDAAGAFPASPEENRLLASYLRIMTLQFCCRYLISGNSTSAIDERTARTVHRKARKCLEDARIGQIDTYFPADFDSFVGQFVKRS